MYIYIKKIISQQKLFQKRMKISRSPIEARYAEFVTSLIHVEDGQRSSRIGFMTLRQRPSRAPPKPEPKPEPEMFHLGKLAPYRERKRTKPPAPDRGSKIDNLRRSMV